MSHCLLALLALLLLDEQVRFCVSEKTVTVDDGHCFPAAKPVPIEPTATPRAYVLATPDGAHATLGVIPAGASRLPEPRCDEVRVRLRMSSNPADVLKLTVKGQQYEWGWGVVRQAALTDVRVCIPEDAQHFVVNAEHHFPETVKFEHGNRDYVVNLVPLPRIRGRVTDETGQGIPATLADESGTLLGSIAEFSGEFEFELARTMPSEVRVTYPGRATQHVVPTKGAIADVGTIVLARSATLVLVPPAEPAIRSIELHRTIDPAERKLVRREVMKGDQPLEIGDLAPSGYQIVAVGEELEKQAINVTLVEGDEKTITLEPDVIRLAVKVRDRGIGARARVRVVHSDERWSAETDTDGDGRFRGQLWQKGTYGVAVRLDGRTTPYLAERTATAAEANWEIDIDGTTIRGRLHTPEGEPVGGERVSVYTVATDGEQRRVCTADEHGGFVIDFVRPGMQTLSVNADGYLPFETTFSTLASDRERQVDVTLLRGQRKGLRVLSETGVPLVGALAYDVTTRSRVRTDANGLATLSLTGALTTVFVVPQEGSFAVATVRADEPDEERIVVPAGDATLSVHFITETSEPLSNAVVLLGFNGYFVPLEVLRLLVPEGSAPNITNAEGVVAFRNFPAGLYSIWAISDIERAGEFAEALPTPFAQIAARPGTNEVTITFRRR